MLCSISIAQIKKFSRNWPHLQYQYIKEILYLQLTANKQDKDKARIAFILAYWCEMLGNLFQIQRQSSGGLASIQLVLGNEADTSLSTTVHSTRYAQPAVFRTLSESKSLLHFNYIATHKAPHLHMNNRLHRKPVCRPVELRSTQTY